MVPLDDPLGPFDPFDRRRCRELADAVDRIVVNAGVVSFAKVRSPQPITRRCRGAAIPRWLASISTPSARTSAPRRIASMFGVRSGGAPARSS
ncbi:hypothetical protein WG70_08450 [Burkholderia oklahomensis EO147]|nr:hypothetical protein WG70_08450 [Burkholderia oklahomensis EO147]KUY51582.1 hypothetical protein WG70_16785 [Burkholderia oklahomensis EO147]